MALSQRGDHRDHPADLLGHGDLVARPGLDPADVEDLGPGLDGTVGGRDRRIQFVGGALVVEGVRGSVDHRHDAERAWWPLPLTEPQCPPLHRQ